ncbi:MAG TPA: MFS transporter [Acidimicrobiales bacterium]|nr:MFS transporter [Acidimicrobiales bacterium]
MRRFGALAPLRHRGVRLLAGGQLASNVGDAVYSVALPWYVLATHGGVLLLGTVLAAYGIPRTVLVAVGGHASDRFKPWTVMMVADAVRALAVGALGATAAFGPARAALLVPIAVVLGVGEGLFLPSSFAIVPTLVPDEDLQAGNSLTSAGTQLATLVGPALGGAAVALVGPSSGFAIDAGTFVVSALTLLGVRRHQQIATNASARVEEVAVGPGAIGVELRDDLHGEVAGALPPAGKSSGACASSGRRLTLRRVLASERALLVVYVVVFAANLGSGGLGEVALPALAHGPLHTGADGYGGLLAAFGAGALTGTLLAAQVRRLRRPTMTVARVLLAGAVVIAVSPYLGNAVALGAGLAVFGGLSGFGSVISITTLQRRLPRALLGRLMGLLMLCSFGTFPVSVVLGGVVVRSLGPAAFFPITGGLLALAILGGLSQKAWRQFGATEHEPEDLHRALAADHAQI